MGASEAAATGAVSAHPLQASPLAAAEARLPAQAAEDDSGRVVHGTCTAAQAQARQDSDVVFLFEARAGLSLQRSLAACWGRPPACSAVWWYCCQPPPSPLQAVPAE